MKPYVAKSLAIESRVGFLFLRLHSTARIRIFFTPGPGFLTVLVTKLSVSRLLFHLFPRILFRVCFAPQDKFGELELCISFSLTKIFSRSWHDNFTVFGIFDLDPTLYTHPTGSEGWNLRELLCTENLEHDQYNARTDWISRSAWKLSIARATMIKTI